MQGFITPHAYARGKEIGCVIVVIVFHKKSPDLEIQAPELLISIKSLSKLAKN